MKTRVLVAMSGGVDSSVAAYLLQQQGYDVIGITFQLYDYSRTNRADGKGGCCSLEDVNDARSVCLKLGIKHFLFDSRERFQKRVVDYFSESYKKGRTPNPCVACNTFIKFDELEYYAQEVNAEKFATGHYAKVVKTNGRPYIAAADDPKKDQSYFLLGVTEEKLNKLLLPLGDYTKAQIREIATSLNLPVSQKPDSQEVCFIPDNDYRRFLKQEAGLTDEAGDIVDESGNILGKHSGIHHFTVGQKKGLHALGLPHYTVLRMDADKRQVVVGFDQSLFSEGLVFEGEAPRADTELVDLSVKIRSRATHVSARWIKSEGNRHTLRFEEPQRAVTPGQFAVLYQEKRVIGGGPILQPVSKFV